MQLVKMQNEATGQFADVHPAEVENYKAGGFHAVQKEEKAQKVKRTRAPKKANDEVRV